MRIFLIFFGAFDSRNINILFNREDLDLRKEIHQEAYLLVQISRDSPVNSIGVDPGIGVKKEIAPHNINITDMAIKIGFFIT